MAESNASRKRKERRKKQDRGLKRLELWVYPDDVEEIKKYAEILNNYKEGIESDRTQ